MLQTDEVDDDYFTPAPNTTLANIFDSPLQQERNKDNESLKYTPPKKQNFTISAEISYDQGKANKDSKGYECLLAYALDAFEWEGNEYIRRGKLGFAILKYSKTEFYNIVLYNSNKVTVSNFSIDTKKCGLFVMTSSPQSIAYFDNNKKYWSLHGKEEDITKIVSVLKNITVEFENISPRLSPTAPKHIAYEENPVRERVEPAYHNVDPDKGSDTDSSVYKKTKASILDRISSMGHSVLPTNITSFKENSSESSESEEFLKSPLKTKPKSNKVKRNNFDKQEISNAVETKQTTITNFEPLASSSALYSIVNGQLMPVSNTVIGNSNTELLHHFMTEQRMNNNELRINVNRTTDKVDQVLDIIKSIKHDQCDSSSTNFQAEIMQKLLSEYEQKIKKYEQILATKTGVETNNSNQPLENCEKQILELKNLLKAKDDEINELKNVHEVNQSLLKEMDDLKTACIAKDEEIKKLLHQARECNIEENSSYNIENKIKDVMNELFHSVIMKIDDGETYSGENLKKIIASIIKNTTKQYFNEPRTEN